jgi:hypothetical protein
MWTRDRRRAQPLADTGEQRVGRGVLGVSEAGLDPQLLGFDRRFVELVGVFEREVRVGIAVHHEQRHGGDAAGHGMGRLR